jgi:hypothetical protein
VEQAESVLSFVEDLNKKQNMDEAEENKKGNMILMVRNLIANAENARCVYWSICK